jgi:hypothetical protein
LFALAGKPKISNYKNNVNNKPWCIIFQVAARCL